MDNTFSAREDEESNNIVPLREFVVQGHNIEELKDRASYFISLVEQRFPSICDKTNLSLKDIEEALAAVLNGREVIVVWMPMDEYDMDGIIYTIQRKDKSIFYIICLNEKIADLLKDDKSKPIAERKPKDEVCAQAYMRALKSVYLHEISHLLLKHVDNGMRASPVASYTSDETPLVAMCQAVYQLYSLVHKKQDFDCDLFAFVLAFWPRKLFTKAVMTTLCNWHDAINGDLRIQVANKFHMTINATSQWMAILFYDKLGMHYVRREEKEKKCLDFLDYKHNVSCFYNNDVFSVKDTAAFTAAHDGKRADYKTLLKESPFLCGAFYERKEWFYNRSADEIIVVGFNAQRVREETDIFMAGVVER